MKVTNVEYTIVTLILIILYFTYHIHTGMYDFSMYLDVQKYQVPPQNKNKSVLVTVVAQSTQTFLESTLNALNNSKHEAGVWIFRNFTDGGQLEHMYNKYPGVKIVNVEEQKYMIHFVLDKFISSEYSVLVYINSYSILSTNWWDILQKSLDTSHGVISLFSTAHNNSAMCRDLLCYTTWLGLVGSVWRKQTAKKVLSETKHLEGYPDRNIEEWCVINSIPLQTVRYPAMKLVQSNAETKLLSRTKQIDSNNELLYQTSHKETSNKELKGKVDQMNTGPTEQASRLLPKCIAAVIRVRIYRDDKPELTAYELEQWIRYVQFAGADKVYLYDAYEREEEKLDYWTKQIFEPGEVVYHDWYFDRTYDIHTSQANAYQHAIDHYETDCEWHLHMDMDEYPFVPKDTEKGFL
jgi:hypothetical protein